MLKGWSASFLRRSDALSYSSDCALPFRSLEPCQWKGARLDAPELTDEMQPLGASCGLFPIVSRPVGDLYCRGVNSFNGLLE